jgi:O-antigen/teichoic acid export membrane protein
MSTIRKKGIITTIFIYIGFLLGALNTYFYLTYFRPEQYGLTLTLMDAGMFFSSISLLGMNTVIAKFFPYYKSHLKDQKSDLLTIAFFFSLMGFLALTALTIYFQPLVIKKYSAKSPLLVDYFYLLYPITFFLVYFQVLEAQAWVMRRAPLSNFLKELLYRALCTGLIVLFVFKAITFHTFAESFAWLYGVLFLVMLVYLMYKGELKMSFKVSKLTKRLKNKMVPYALFILGGNVITILAKTIDALMISSVSGLQYTAVFQLSYYMASVIEVPSRTVTSMATPVISEAWKERDMAKLDRVYRKTSINLLIASTFIFTFIWLNYDNVFALLNVDPIYLLGKPIVFILGITKIVELGTGANSAIIITSRRWKFELYSNIILLVCMLPLTYYMIKKYGMVGAGYANFISITTFNLIRFVFLWRVFKLQPFTIKTLIALAIPLGLYFVLYYGVNFSDPIVNIVVRSALYTGGFALLILQFKVSEDVQQVYGTIINRIKKLRT